MDLPFAVPEPHNASSSSSPSVPIPSCHQLPTPGDLQPNGVLLYTNLIPGHYRYGARPPPPPPGPLSLPSNATSSRKRDQLVRDSRECRVGSDESYRSQISTISTIPIDSSSKLAIHQPCSPPIHSLNRRIVQVSEPDDDEEEDDDILVIATSDMEEYHDDHDVDDEKLYRPFGHTTNCGSNGTAHTAIDDRSDQSHEATSKIKVDSQNKMEWNAPSNSKPIDLLSVLLSGPVHGNLQESNTSSNSGDITILIEEATTKSRKARSVTNELTSHQNTTKLHDHDQHNSHVENYLFVATVNAHTEAALSFQRVYRSLLGIHVNNSTNSSGTVQPRANCGPSCSQDLARSMIVLANGHARTAASLGTMGAKWNMGISESLQPTASKNERAANKRDSKIHSRDDAPSNTVAEERHQSMPQHERLRMAVRGALDTANNEEDITNSTFLAQSTRIHAANHEKSENIIHSKSNTIDPVTSVQVIGRVDTEVNPVDDLMNLEKELKGMDMVLEVGNSVNSLSAAVSSRPGGSLYVVPPIAQGSFYTSSSMWASATLGRIGGVNTQQPSKHHDRVDTMSPKGTVGVRPSVNLMHNILGGGRPPSNPSPSTPPSAPPTPAPPAQSATAGLDQSWWGGGQGSIMSSVLLSSAISTIHTSRRSPPHPSSHNSRRDSANTKQLMQLMDSLKRLGDENAHLMREVEEAKSAREEAKTAKNMMEQFKKEYNQRFLKVKEALETYPRSGVDNPVHNSSHMKASTMELQKRDQIIKKLAADLRKEREDGKKKDQALRKYEGFYREVKARSAEKARQRMVVGGQKWVPSDGKGGG